MTVIFLTQRNTKLSLSMDAIHTAILKYVYE